MSDSYPEFGKIPRLYRECCITEKIDGTNGLIAIQNGVMRVGSRTKWITPVNDNFGFAKWAETNREELLKLGDGLHYGEWWGQGIQRRYGLTEKRFSLFNTSRWTPENTPKCCHVVPVLWSGIFSTDAARSCIENLRENGSLAAPGFMRPEGVVVYHVAAGSYFKATLESDEERKSILAVLQQFPVPSVAGDFIELISGAIG